MDLPNDNGATETPTALPNAAPKQLPYRWGYFQGGALIPFSLLVILGALSDAIKPDHDPRYHFALAISIGLLGLPLAYGLLLKKKFAIVMIYGMFGLWLAATAIQLVIAIKHHNESGYRGSAIPEAELLLVWFFSIRYYQRRKSQFS
jgi:hypothetical protein